LCRAPSMCRLAFVRAPPLSSLRMCGTKRWLSFDGEIGFREKVWVRKRQVARRRLVSASLSGAVRATTPWCPVLHTHRSCSSDDYLGPMSSLLQHRLLPFALYMSSLRSKGRKALDARCLEHRRRNRSLVCTSCQYSA